MSSESKDLHTTKDGQDTEQKSLIGSAYSYDANVQISKSTATELADADDKDD